MSLVDALVSVGLCCTFAEARKNIQAGMVRVNNEKVMDIEHQLESSPCFLSRGRAIVFFK